MAKLLFFKHLPRHCKLTFWIKEGFARVLSLIWSLISRMWKLTTFVMVGDAWAPAIGILQWRRTCYGHQIPLIPTFCYCDFKQNCLWYLLVVAEVLHPKTHGHLNVVNTRHLPHCTYAMLRTLNKWQCPFIGICAKSATLDCLPSLHYSRLIIVARCDPASACTKPPIRMGRNFEMWLQKWAWLFFRILGWLWRTFDCIFTCNETVN